MNQIAIYGASGHGKVVADIAKSNGYDDIIFIDDLNIEYISFSDFLSKKIKIPVALGIGDNRLRAKLYQNCLDSGLEVKTLIHSDAILSESVSIGEGTIIMANVVINADTKVGKCCIINSASVIEHDNNIDDFVHVSPNVACAGNVNIGRYTHLGLASCIIQGIHIGADTTIGAGSVVVENINKNVLAYGNPCKVKKEKI